MQVYFSCKNLNFFDLKFDQDPDVDPYGSALVLLPGSGSGSIEIKAGSGSSLKPMRSHNTSRDTTQMSSMLSLSPVEDDSDKTLTPVIS
jgi:hypothetical protein